MLPKREDDDTVTIYCCADATLTYGPYGGAKIIKQALPVCFARNADEAESLITLVGQREWHPRTDPDYKSQRRGRAIPAGTGPEVRHRYSLNDYRRGDVDTLDNVAATLTALRDAARAGDHDAERQAFDDGRARGRIGPANAARVQGTPMSGIPWEPLREGTVNPQLVEQMKRAGVWQGADAGMRVYMNNLYQVIERTEESGFTWLSIKRHDRRLIRVWRHLQQIKNEVCGMEREAVELFPAESRLVDGANETHLWVFPEGTQLPFGFPQGLVSDDEDVEAFNAARERGEHQGRQEPWQEGLTTGRNEHTRFASEEQRAKLRDLGMG